MAQQVKAPAAKPDSLNLISETYILEEKTSSYKLSSDFHIVLWHTCAPKNLEQMESCA